MSMSRQYIPYSLLTCIVLLAEWGSGGVTELHSKPRYRAICRAIYHWVRFIDAYNWWCRLRTIHALQPCVWRAFAGRMGVRLSVKRCMDHHNPSYAQRIEGEVTAFQNQICVIRMHPKKKGLLGAAVRIAYYSQLQWDRSACTWINVHVAPVASEFKI